MIGFVRSLTVTTDGEPLSFSGRVRLRGQDELSLFPALFTLEMWNLPEEAALRISRCRKIAVSHEGACLVSGSVSDVYRRAVPEGILTSVSISLGLDLWEARVSVHVSSGKTVSETVRAILSASGTGIPFLSKLDPDPVVSRGQSFFGRAAECVTVALTAAGCKPMLTPAGVMAVPQGGLPEPVRISEKDLTDAPVFAAGGKIMILSCTVAGWRPGQTVLVEYKSIQARGMVTSRSVDADTGAGAWKCEMMAEVLK